MGRIWWACSWYRPKYQGTEWEDMNICWMSRTMVSAPISSKSSMILYLSLWLILTRSCTHLGKKKKKKRQHLPRPWGLLSVWCSYGNLGWFSKEKWWLAEIIPSCRNVTLGTLTLVKSPCNQSISHRTEKQSRFPCQVCEPECHLTCRTCPSYFKAPKGHDLFCCYLFRACCLSHMSQLKSDLRPAFLEAPTDILSIADMQQKEWVPWKT